MKKNNITAEKFNIKRALISCWDKTGVAEFASILTENEIEIISSGGTAEHLRKHNIPVKKVEEVTGFPEILDGRVKTLHPAIHAAILARRNSQHLSQLQAQGIQHIDLVVVNLYPFLQYVKAGEKSLAEMIELIDIGGPAMIRSAAKNYENIVVLHKPEQYQEFLNIFKKESGEIPLQYRQRWAAKAFFYTSYYDSQIAAYLNSQQEEKEFPSYFSRFFVKKQDLRYGENPHQDASLYRMFYDASSGKNEIERLSGKEMSYNNYVDVTAAYTLVSEFSEPAVAIIKHTNPCGASVGVELPVVFEKAFAGDPLSAFGGIVATNREVDEKTAELIHKSFYECVIAPGFSEPAIRILRKKKNLRLLKRKIIKTDKAHLQYKFLDIGLLVQKGDVLSFDPGRLSSAASRKPTETERQDMLFAWIIVKHVKSNAIVFVKNKQLLGVGAGQMSRVDAVKLAATKALSAGHDLHGAVMASDAFFPFRDGIDEAARAGISAVIQPGGSIRDNEVIEAASYNGMAMLLTGIRHFKH